MRIAREEKQPANIVAETITQIADKERKEAIRKGDYPTAVFAGIAQYYADRAQKESRALEKRW